MRLAIHDYSIKLNDTFHTNFQIRYNNIPVDLSAYTSALMQIRENENADPVLSFSSTGGTININNLAAGQITITGQTNTVTIAGDYFYDLQLSNSSTTETISTGTFRFISDYTN